VYAKAMKKHANRDTEFLVYDIADRPAARPQETIDFANTKLRLFFILLFKK